MNKIKVIIFVLTFIPIIAYADMGSCYILKVDIKTIENESLQGYFSIGSYDFYIEHRNNSVFYSSKAGWKELCVSDPINYNQLKVLNYNKLFFQHILDRTTEDTLSIKNELIRFTYNDQLDENLIISKLVGNEIKISKNDIKTFKVTSIFTCGVGEFIVTDLNEKDKDWATSENFVQAEFIGGSEMCSYKVISFNKSTNESDSDLNELKSLIDSRGKMENEAQTKSLEYPKDAINNINIKIIKAIHKLKKHKIIIANFCSC